MDRTDKPTQGSVLDLLLRPAIPNVQKNLPTSRCEVKRLSALVGAPVIFDLRALSYQRIREIQESNGDTELEILLAGIVDPDLRSPELQEKFGGATPAETVKSMLLAGEVSDIAHAIERLSGYRMSTIEMVKNG